MASEGLAVSATYAAAIKGYLEGLALGVPVFRDRAPLYKSDGTAQPLPYVVVTDGLSITAERTGDGRYKRGTELVQVDVYEQIANTDGTRAESFTLVEDIYTGLLGARLTTAPKRVWRAEGFSRVRFRDDSLNEIRTSISFTLRRKMQD
jgi:hypothetical protein